MTPCPADDEVQAFVEGTSSAAEYARISEHVAGCAPCAALVARLGDSLLTPSQRVPDEPRLAWALPAIGARLGRYALLDRIGAGAMGVVFAAYDPVLDRKVALKLVRPGMTEEHARRMVREARLMARVTHPNVVAVYDAGEVDGQVFIAMAHVAGATLREWLAAAPRSVRAITDAFAAAGRGLAAAHEAGIVHRDFKPDNVLCADDGRVLVTDFGLARAELAEPASVQDEAEPVPPAAPDARASALVGTPAYMAPEQRRGEQADAGADVYAFCVSLWQALFGAYPYDGSRPGVPAKLVRALKRGLEPDRARRASLSAVLRALEPKALRLPLVAGAIALALSLTLLAIRPSTPPCSPPDDLLVGVWDPPTRSAVERGLSGAASPYARTVAASVLRLLDTYVERWKASHVAACSATRVDGRQSETVLDRRMGCLDGRRRQLRALVGALLDPTPDGVEQAVAAASRLPDVGHCDELAYVSADVPPPPAPLASLVASQRELLDRARAALETGIPIGALVVGSGVAATAGAIGYAPLIAESRLLLARARTSDDPKAAVVELHRAGAAADASGHAVLAAAIRLELVRVLATNLGETDAATVWADYCAASLERIGSPAGLVAELDFARANILFKQGRREEALAAHRAVRAYFERTDPGGLMEATVDNQIGIDLAELGRFDEALASFARTRERREDLLDLDHPQVIDLVGNLAILERMRGNTEAALALNQEAITRRERLVGADDLRLASMLHSRVDMLYDLQRYGEAMEVGQRALKIAEARFGPEGIALDTLLQSLAETASGAGQADTAEALAARAVAIVEKAGPHHPDLGPALSVQATIAHGLHGCARSRSLFEASVAEFEAAGRVDDPRFAFPLDGVGRCATSAGDAARGVALHRRAIALRERVLGPEHAFLTDSLQGLGRALIALGTPEALAEARAVLAARIAARIARSDIVREVESIRAELGRATELPTTR